MGFLVCLSKEGLLALTPKPSRQFGLYAGSDPRHLPAYSIKEAAHYLRIPPATLRSWVKGTFYPTEQGRRFFHPIIDLLDKARPVLSFMNLVEAHVLDAIRREHDIPMNRVRRALNYLHRRYPAKHPLADQAFETDGSDLFIQKLGQLINVSREGQLAMRAYSMLICVVSSVTRLAQRHASIFSREKMQEPKLIVVDPLVSFGRPVLAGTGVPTMMIAERYKAGESIDDLANDYGAKDRRSKRRSGASLKLKRPEPVLFLDRSLGKHKIAEALRAAGIEVRVHDDIFTQDAQDVEWLPEVGRRGWLVLTKDSHLRYNQVELTALMNACVRVFILVTGTSRQRTWPRSSSRPCQGSGALQRNTHLRLWRKSSEMDRLRCGFLDERTVCE